MQIFASALQGLDAAEGKLDQTANRISRASVAGTGAAGDSVDLSTEMVNLLTAKQAYEVNLKSLQVGNEITKHTLDILA
ncbi:MAG TPA: flagellar basal body rod C-terminal domain-containing protein [Bryobacteraceae bacterium]|nr:flagellar basal body rod C-terminal domain-containing protein [Bryobacteraceae bacterium]